MKERCTGSRLDVRISVYQKDNESFFFGEGNERSGESKTMRIHPA